LIDKTLRAGPGVC